MKNEEISAAAAAMGKKGGKSKSDAKKKASRKNIKKATASLTPEQKKQRAVRAAQVREEKRVFPFNFSERACNFLYDTFYELSLQAEENAEAVTLCEKFQVSGGIEVDENNNEIECERTIKLFLTKKEIQEIFYFFSKNYQNDNLTKIKHDI